MGASARMAMMARPRFETGQRVTLAQAAYDTFNARIAPGTPCIVTWLGTGRAWVRVENVALLAADATGEAFVRTDDMEPVPDEADLRARNAAIKPPNSKWAGGWLISMTSIDGFEMVRFPGGIPFVMHRDDWDRLPDYRPVQ